MNGPADNNTGSSSVTYEISLQASEAAGGVTRILPRNNKRLQVRVPPGVVDGQIVKLTNALQVTDGKPGDILVRVKIKTAAAPPPDAPEGVIDVTDDSFDEEVLRSPLPVAVDFWAAWCGPCKMMSPVLEEAARQYRGKIKFCKINVDENPGMAARYQASSIPMLLFFKNGQVVDKSVGAIPAEALRSHLDPLS